MDRARLRALEIADDADLRIRAPKNFLSQSLDETRTAGTRLKPSLDPRLPVPGTPLIRRYQGKDVIVHVRADGGFHCNGRIYKSLSNRCHGHTMERLCFLQSRAPARSEAWRVRIPPRGCLDVLGARLLTRCVIGSLHRTYESGFAR